MFVRTMLALSLSCIFACSAFAASAAEQPLNPKAITNAAVQDPIDPLAVDSASAAPAQITAQEQQDLNQASKTLNDLQKTEDQTAPVGASPSASTPAAPSSAPAAKDTWTLDGINNAQ